MRNKIFGVHRVRANFYHFVSALYISTMGLWLGGVISDPVATWFGFTLFVADYIAEMYDPNPESPGPWFASHFHRFLDDDTED